MFGCQKNGMEFNSIPLIFNKRMNGIQFLLNLGNGQILEGYLKEVEEIELHIFGNIYAIGWNLEFQYQFMWFLL